jgi:hypothetical protein
MRPAAASGTVNARAALCWERPVSPFAGRSTSLLGSMLGRAGKDKRVQPSLLTRLRWWLEELRHLDDTKLVGGLLLIAALAFGGFLAARVAARKSASRASTATQMVTVRQKVRVHRHGHVVTRWRVRRLSAEAQTVMSTQTISTPSGVRLVTHPVTRYRVVYRNRPVDVPAKTVTLTQQVTDSQIVTVTHRVTVVQTTTAMATVTQTVPVTITITVPLP